MSTPEDATAISGSVRHNDETTTQPVLPIFAPVREPSDNGASQPGSASSSSRISPIEFQRRSRADFRESSSPRNSSGSVDYDNSPIQAGRRQKRSSGGFLLETTTKSSILSKSLLFRSQQDKKGKRKSDGSELSIPKRRNRNELLEQRISVGSSPLSTELRRDGASLEDQEVEDVARNGSVEQPGQANGIRIASNNWTPESQRSSTPVVGFDTDPAQIVDMALRLSEGRRRHFSNQRQVSGDIPGRRLVSTSKSVQRGGRALSTSLGPHRASMSQALPVTPTKGPTPEIKTNAVVEVSPTSDHPFFRPESQDVLFDISGATIIRVEKAKTYIELAYEHRRLLSHLPPIRRPDDQSSSRDNLPESRTYNPLQYARNRKLRLREKCAINAEADGWHDVEKVRTWVDTVMRSHTETRHDPVECVRLPPLSQQQVDVTDHAESPSQTGHKSQDPPARPKRPKSDWVTHPGTLIADAHWLEQGLNKTRIQDRDNNQIYPSNTQFKFSGWRNFTPVKVNDMSQRPTTPAEDLTSATTATTEALNLESPPELPTFISAHKRVKDKDRKKKSRKIRKAKTKDSSRGSRNQSRALPDDSASQSSRSSSASASNRDSQRRGRKRLGVFDIPDGDLFGRSTSRKPDKSEERRPVNSSQADLSDYKFSRSSIEEHKLIKYLRLNSARKDSQSDVERPRTPYATGSQHDLSGITKHRKASTDYDTTAPTSPMQEAWPSIAINLSPPPSRSPSPTKKNKNSLLHSILDRHHSQDREKIERNDFAIPRSKSHSRDASTDTDRNGSSSNQRSRGTSPFTKSQNAIGKQTMESPEEIAPITMEHRGSTLSRMSTKSTATGDPSRIRGIFKGGRIAELVGNEVTRVGDFIWKRDIPSSEISNRSFDGSATDDDGPNGYLSKKKSLRRRTTSSSTKHSKDGRQSLESTENETSPQYHNPNLPSFTSPFQKDREKQDKKRDDGSPEIILPTTEDHISRQAADFRSRGKSPRLDLLAPPKLDTSASRSQSADGRRGSYGFGAAMNLNKPRTASQAYNDAINGRTGSEGHWTGSTADFSGQLRNSIIEVGTPSRPQKIGKQDIARIQALLLISAVKAKGLVEVQEQIPPAPSKFLIGSLSEDRKAILASQPLRIRRREEHIFAARNLIGTLSEQSSAFGDKLIGFSSDTVTQLHSEIQVLEDTIDNTLTPRVRITADNAGELSMKLTTTSTLAVKALNDIISEAFRIRKRGPFRWLRLSGYKAIEWGVVSLLWIIWAVVTSIRLFITTVRGVVWFGKWLVWAV